MTSAPAIGFEYRSSRWTAYLLLVVTSLTIMAIALSGLGRMLQVLAGMGVLALCARALHRLRLPITAVGWANQSGWSLHGRDGMNEPATLQSFKIVRTVVLLRLASRRYGRLTFWLMPDNSDADIRRRLRMRLVVLRADPQEAAS